jgi:hypothetical protein
MARELKVEEDRLLLLAIYGQLTDGPTVDGLE